ncbi:MAG: methyltransferase domain-containing protein [Deltaproteobacteria bacterium]|nr:methyltransferase domain-containing protein [Deltaproteobacteria bacterium]
MSTYAVHKERKLKGYVGLGVKKAFSFFYSDRLNQDELFAQEIIPCLTKESFVLDAGCGNGTSFHYDLKQNVRYLVGCDLGSSISKNTNIMIGIRTNLECLPFARESFDIIFSRYVLEHLSEPGVIFSEFARILRPGGKLIVLTPSKFHYTVLLSRLTPHRFHEFVSALRGNLPEDTFPTKYLCNSRTELIRIAQEAGLTLTKIVHTEVSPNYLLWSLPSFLAGVAYERIVNKLSFLSALRVSIIAVFQR